MEFYFADENGINTGILPRDAYIDIDIGNENDFIVTIPLSLYDPAVMVQGGYIYAPGTEYGGIMNSLEINTGNSEVSFEGKTFRGMLQDQYTNVPSGQDYLVTNGEVQACMRSVIGSTLYDGLIVLPNISTESIIGNTQIDRYCDYLRASYIILGKANRKPVLKVVEGVQSDLINFHVELTSEPIRDLSDEIENSQDGLVQFVIRKADAMPYQYILALGSGELKDRTVVMLKINSNGTLSEVPSIPNTARVYKYDFPSAESREQLIDEALKQIPEINPTDSQSITLSDDVKASIDDIIGGRDYVTGTYIKQPITKVTYKYSNNKESYSYTIGDD